MELFMEFNRVGVTLLIATHDIALILSMSQRIIKLDKGRIVADGWARK
jgi:cell division transport system ATP-binding protein